jgi:2-hydroxychromene-2-carboxylate isomerase
MSNASRSGSTTANWYFDFISPFGYLQLARFGELPEALEVTLKPVVFAGLLKHHGQLGPAEIPSKRTFTYRFAHWQAHRRGLPFRMPPSHPFNPLAPLRLAVATGGTRDSVATIYRYIWGEGGDIQSEAGLNELGNRLGVPDVAAAVAAPAVKERLRANTDEAIAAQAFGVPTFVVDGEVFWGDDATQMVSDFVADPAMFQTDEMQRIADMPMGILRR